MKIHYVYWLIEKYNNDFIKSLAYNVKHFSSDNE